MCSILNFNAFVVLIMRLAKVYVSYIFVRTLSISLTMKSTLICPHHPPHHPRREREHGQTHHAISLRPQRTFAQKLSRWRRWVIWRLKQARRPKSASLKFMFFLFSYFWSEFMFWFFFLIIVWFSFFIFGYVFG